MLHKILLFLAASVVCASLQASGVLGYYRFPALHGDTVVFTAEGDLWKAPITGGLAQRLTTHHGVESHAAISPDGSQVAFAASYEGPREIYLMPITGGLPRRLTWEGQNGAFGPYPVSWTTSGKILYATKYFAQRYDWQLVELDSATGLGSIIPLFQASAGVVDSGGDYLYFTRLPRQSSHAKRYQGGYIENIWRFKLAGGIEAELLTSDYAGTSREPMFWNNRVYFTSDRNGTMNIWSMNPDGANPEQHTTFQGWDVLSASLNDGRIVFQNQADLWLYDCETKETRKLEIRLGSDLDQTRERWIKKPLDFLTAFHPSPNGDRLALTVRGRVFVVPARQGRTVELTRDSGVRYRSARFVPDGKDLLLLSDRTGEIEFWRYPANGFGAGTQLSRDARTLRFQGAPSPDGKRIAHTDRDQKLWILDLETKEPRLVATAPNPQQFDNPDLAWSPDSQWLAYVMSAPNATAQIHLYNVETGQSTTVTTDRLDSYSPAWHPDGKWLYFLSDRVFRSIQPSPWGPRQPEPFLDKTTKIYLLDVAGGERSPFAPDDELHLAEKPGNNDKKEDSSDATENSKNHTARMVRIDLDGIMHRLYEVPLAAGNYRNLQAAKSHLYFVESNPDLHRQSHLKSLPIKNRDRELTTILEQIDGYQITEDAKKLAVKKGDAFYIFEASGKAPTKLDSTKVDVSKVTFSISPREEWRQIFTDAWRLHRDYFYDPQMHQVDWVGALEKHRPLLDRVADRREVDDLIAQMVGELSAMHTNIRPGDTREGADSIQLSYLGARWSRDEARGGYRIDHIYQGDPDYPDAIAPLARFDRKIRVGDVIESINGVSTLAVEDPSLPLRNQSGRQVLLSILPREGEPFKTIVEPISGNAFRDLKLTEWEYTRRLRVDELSEEQIGYFHMRAMSAGNFSEFVKGFYPVFQRQGLIIDMRHNFGGNIDSWILGRLLRKPWMFWRGRTGAPFSNMQYAFNGHMVVLIDSYTISDGEAFAEGFRRLGLGPLIGTQTWGGGIWLRSTNVLVDNGVARSPELGVYGLDGAWLIEGEGLRPDIGVDNLPHATFNGRDAQLEAAVDYLQKKIAEEPRLAPEPPPYPNRFFQYEAN